MLDFILHDSRGHISGKPRVAAAPAVFAGVYDTQSREILKPEPAAVRAALPYRWRRAFDRAASGFWFDKESRVDEKGHHRGAPPYIELRDYRGSWLNTVYAIPCRRESAEC